MPDQAEQRRQLRIAIVRGDTVGLSTLLSGQPWPDDALQLIGDGLLRAVEGGPSEEVAELARTCVSALHARNWEGDDELAESLAARLGTGPTRLLRPLALDLEELAFVLDGDSEGGRIDLLTGEVWARAAIEYAEETGMYDDSEDPDRWLWFVSAGSHEGYRDMESFIARIGDPEVADRLSIAIDGRGAFRRFKDVLSRWPDLRERWFGFADERQRGRARAWLAGQGYEAIPQVPPGDGPTDPAIAGP